MINPKINLPSKEQEFWFGIIVLWYLTTCPQSAKVWSMTVEKHKSFFVALRNDLRSTHTRIHISLCSYLNQSKLRIPLISLQKVALNGSWYKQNGTFSETTDNDTSTVYRYCLVELMRLIVYWHDFSTNFKPLRKYLAN